MFGLSVRCRRAERWDRHALRHAYRYVFRYASGHASKMHIDVCRRANRSVNGHCVDVRVDMCIAMCIDMRRDMCLDLRAGMPYRCTSV